ncbi:Hint domain-containing protein [Corallococcus sp. EGB]|uniref:Hint domain-containing protein n=1 Tax=Corallococcus sp. EGB TaxID=1521117 RepID=UPI001CBCA914|nr:Hint domain-containing protein [Corallococcus sp. EGB]
MRSREQEEAAGIYDREVNGVRSPQLIKTRYLDIRWTHEELLPAHLLAGFQVVVYEGSDPNNTDSYLLEPRKFGPSERRWVAPLKLTQPTQVQCAVQALYTNGNQSSWRVLGGGVVADPDTITMAVADLSNVPTGSVSARHMSASSVTSAAVAAAAISFQHLLLPPTDNLVPNGYSEVDAQGKSPEGDGLVDEPANAKEGRRCRKLTVPAGGGFVGLNFIGGFRSTAPGGRIKCTAGDQFFAEAWLKSSAALTQPNATLFLLWEGANGGYESQLTTTPVTLTASYQRVKLKGTCPAGCTGVQLYFELNAASADAGKAVYLDAVSMRKMVTFDLLVANTLQTSNYAEDGNGVPVAGAKLDNVGTAFKAAGGNVQIGSYLLDTPFFRANQALDGTSAAGRVHYRGSNNTGVRGGAPLIDRLDVQCTDYFRYTTPIVHSWLEHHFFVQPSSIDDNLDALRYLKVDYYSSFNATYRGTRYIPLPDRKYASAVDGNALNRIAVSHTFQYPAALSGLNGQNLGEYVALFCEMHGVYGVSASMWFTPVYNAGLGINFAKSIASPFSGAPSGGGGGGSGGTGGTCVAPETLITLEDGQEVPAASLRPGMRVLTQHEETRRVGVFEVVAASSHRAARWCVELTDGRVLVATPNHLLYRRFAGWTELRALRPGELLEGLRPGLVRRVVPEGEGAVVKLTVHGARTYESAGLLSHNIKQPI